MHAFLRVELGKLYLQAGVIQEPDEEVEEGPGQLAHNDQPLVEYAQRPGFRILGADGFTIEDH